MLPIGTATVKAMAFKSDMLDSIVVSIDFTVAGSDILLDRQKNLDNTPVDDIYFAHICVKFDTYFIDLAIGYANAGCKALIIHSTVPPNTTKVIQDSSKVPIIYSPIRGVHKRFLEDLKRYKKFYAIQKQIASAEIELEFNKRFPNNVYLLKPITLELAKLLCDTTYYGMLIAYRKATDMIAKKYEVDGDEMWQFAKEINEFPNNRPVMFNDHKKIGGHCVMPNLKLLGDSTEELEISNYIRFYSEMG